MTPSFRSYYLRECQRLCGLKTTSVKAFAACAESHAPSAREALFFYALSDDRIDYLMRCVKTENLRAEYSDVKARLAAMTPEAALSCRESLPTRYGKTLSCYLYESRRTESDRRLVASYRHRVKSLMAERTPRVTMHAVAKTIGADKSNLYGWLSKDDDSKVSLALARRVYDCLAPRQSTETLSQVERDARFRAMVKAMKSDAYSSLSK